MDLFKRIGTQKKKFKVQFFIGRLKFSSYRAGKVYIVIKRGDRKVKSELKIQMSEDNKLNFNKEILQLQVTLFFDQKQNRYQQKTGEMNVVLLDQKQSKVLLGVVHFDVAEYANSGQQSIKQKKKLQQTSKKLQGLIQYNVFVKYIGEGSESSIDKVSDFFFGKTKQQPQSAKIKQQSKVQESKKKDLRKEQRKSQEDLSDNEKPIKNDKNISKQKHMIKTTIKKQKDQLKMQGKHSKNYVTANKNNMQKEKQYLTSENDDSISKNNFYFDQPQTDKQVQKASRNGHKKRSNSVQKPLKGVGVRGPQNKFKKTRNKSSQDGSDKDQQDEDIETSEVEPVNTNTMFLRQQQSKTGKTVQKVDNKVALVITQTKLSSQQYIKGGSGKYPLKKQIPTLEHSTSVQGSSSTKNLQQQLQKYTQQNQSLRSLLQQSQFSVKQLRKQLSSCNKQNNELSQQFQYYQSQLRQKQQELLKQRDTMMDIQRSTDKQKNDEFSKQQIKRLQKEKNQFIVQCSRLKEKYKQDFKKYEQVLSQKQQKQQQLNQKGRAQIQRLKQQCSCYRQKIQKLTKQKDQKSSSYNKVKSQAKNYDNQISQLKSCLSRHKIKICNRLNEALAKNQQTIIDLLMELNKD